MRPGSLWKRMYMWICVMCPGGVHTADLCAAAAFVRFFAAVVILECCSGKLAFAARHTVWNARQAGQECILGRAWLSTKNMNCDVHTNTHVLDHALTCRYRSHPGGLHPRMLLDAEKFDSECFVWVYFATWDYSKAFVLKNFKLEGCGSSRAGRGTFFAPRSRGVVFTLNWMKGLTLGHWCTTFIQHICIHNLHKVWWIAVGLTTAGGGESQCFPLPRALVLCWVLGHWRFDFTTFSECAAFKRPSPRTVYRIVTRMDQHQIIDSLIMTPNCIGRITVFNSGCSFVSAGLVCTCVHKRLSVDLRHRLYTWAEIDLIRRIWFSASCSQGLSPVARV